MTDTVLVSFGGEELELRSLSAREYLSAGVEAAKMSEELGGDEISQAILLGACLLSRGLFDGDSRAFPTAHELLDMITAQEIIDTAKYVELEPETKISVIETADKIKRMVRAETEIVSASGDRQVQAAADDENGKIIREDVEPVSDKPAERQWESVEDRKTMPREDNLEDASAKRKTTFESENTVTIRRRGLLPRRDDLGTLTDENTDTQFQVSSGILSPRDGMRRVSDFFERDSRRYDGAITSY